MLDSGISGEGEFFPSEGGHGRTLVSLVGMTQGVWVPPIWLPRGARCRMPRGGLAQKISFLVPNAYSPTEVRHQGGISVKIELRFVFIRVRHRP